MLDPWSDLPEQGSEELVRAEIEKLRQSGFDPYEQLEKELREATANFERPSLLMFWIGLPVALILFFFSPLLGIAVALLVAFFRFSAIVAVRGCAYLLGDN